MSFALSTNVLGALEGNLCVFKNMIFYWISWWKIKFMKKSILWKYLFKLKSNAIQRMSLDYDRESSRYQKLMVIELWSIFHVWWFMIKCRWCKSAGFKKFVWSGSPKQHYKRCKSVPRCITPKGDIYLFVFINFKFYWDWTLL